MLTRKRKEIVKWKWRAGWDNGDKQSIFLISGDYYLKVSCSKQDATSFSIKVEGFSEWQFLSFLLFFPVASPPQAGGSTGDVAGFVRRGRKEGEGELSVGAAALLGQIVRQLLNHLGIWVLHGLYSLNRFRPVLNLDHAVFGTGYMQTEQDK